MLAYGDVGLHIVILAYYRDVAFRKVGVLSRCWLIIAVLVCRYVGLLSQGWRIGMLAYRGIGSSRCWLIVAMSAYRDVGLLWYWLIVLLAYRHAGLSRG